MVRIAKRLLMPLAVAVALVASGLTAPAPAFAAASGGWAGNCYPSHGWTYWGGWCDGQGPDYTYYAWVRCTDGNTYYGALLWDGDRTGSWAYCPNPYFVTSGGLNN